MKLYTCTAHPYVHMHTYVQRQSQWHQLAKGGPHLDASFTSALRVLVSQSFCSEHFF